MAHDRFDKFTDRSKKVLFLAQEEAANLYHNYVGTEHLLLGLASEGEGVAATVLANMDVSLDKIREATEFIIGRGDRPVVGEVGLTPRARRVIELGIDEARRMGHNYIGTEHLLLGLVREGEGIAAGILESLGVNLDKTRNETLKILTYNSANKVRPEKTPDPLAAIRQRDADVHYSIWASFEMIESSGGDIGEGNMAIRDRHELLEYIDKHLDRT